MRDCENMTIYAAAEQIRINKSHNIICHVFSQSDPTVEKCTNLVFAPYTLRYPGLSQQFQDAGLDVSEDRWNQVFDFTHNPEAPNWRLMNPDEFTGIKEFPVIFFCKIESLNILKGLLI